MNLTKEAVDWRNGVAEALGGPEEAEEPATWRHAVMFDGSPLSDSAHRPVAEELLSEWGRARGLTPLGYIYQERDYRIGHGMEFSGEMMAPSRRTRLQGEGTKVPEWLEGREERVPWPFICACGAPAVGVLDRQPMCASCWEPYLAAENARMDDQSPDA